jgi:CheY-like chemotaxis protein/MinD-like ATPase involved in chromosome partitioning or flagellar assembly
MAAKILVVDDDLETLRLVGLMLQRQGFEIAAANNGLQAITIAKKEHPDLIVLDIMMPDMDGYEVTRQIRKNPETAGTAILMFTAKSQVDDKVAGYDAGIDDYLTKPIHPAELVARIKALLARGKARNAPILVPKGYTIGFLAAKGGIGLSTTILNLGIALHQRHKLDVLAAELRPGQGSIGPDNGFSNPDSLNHLLQLKPSEIIPETIEKQLLQTTFGVRLLLASSRIKDADFAVNTEQMELIVQQLPILAKVVLLDIGASFLPHIDRILASCQELVIATEPYPSSVQRTRVLMDEVGQFGFGKSRLLHLLTINRLRADIQLSITQIQEMLGQPIAQVISPVPEMAFQAVQRGIPLLIIQPEGLYSQQLNQLAGQVAERVNK